MIRIYLIEYIVGAMAAAIILMQLPTGTLDSPGITAHRHRARRTSSPASRAPSTIACIVRAFVVR